MITDRTITEPLAEWDPPVIALPANIVGEPLEYGLEYVSNLGRPEGL